MRLLLPERLNELIGLQHMKFFIFDDSIIISGYVLVLETLPRFMTLPNLCRAFRANLSDNYFTCRQDRAILIENSPMLVEFFSSLFDVIAAFSLKLKEDGGISFQGEPKMDPLSGGLDLQLYHYFNWNVPSLGDSNRFKEEVNARLNAHFSEFQRRLASTNSGSTATDTFICPFLQMGTFRIGQELELLKRLFSYKASLRKLRLHLPWQSGF